MSYTAKFSVEATPDPEPNYYILIGLNTTDEMATVGTKITFMITISYNVPDDVYITVRGRLNYKIITPATGDSISTKYNLSNHSCNGVGYDVIKVDSSSGMSPNNFEGISWVNKYSSPNVYNIEAEWTL